MLKKILEKVIAIILIMVLTSLNFIYLGSTVVSYAIGVLDDTTNSENVKFMAYFKTTDNQNVNVKEEKINEENIKLYLSVAVENNGYFNGNIEFLDNNFSLKNIKKNEKINKIDGNKIVLNQIIAGETAELELGIEAKKGEVIDASLLNMESKIKLTGTYTNSNAKKIEIDATKTVQLILEDPYEKNEGAEIKAELITNKIYNIDGTNKRIIQVKVKSKLEGNKYPVKETKIEMGVPEGTEEVKVITIGTKATNGKGAEEFTEDNWEYVKEEKKVRVKIENKEEDGKISWNKEAEDVIVVTYILPEKAEVTNKEIKIEEGIKLYNRGETEKKAEGQVKIEEDKDGTIEVETKNEEKEIYKGKIYSKEEREIKTKEEINVNYAELVEGIEVVEKQATYENGKTELTANVEYKTTKIDKEKMEEVLGQEGIIEIEDQNGRNIGKITTGTEVNAEGKIEIKYETGVKGIRIKTSKPEKTGTIEIEHTKAIKGEEYTKEEIQGLNKIKEEVVLVNNKATYRNEIELKETTTKAKMKINKKSITTVTENKGIEIKATLETNKEKYDLYKNPTIKIELPKEVESVKVNSINLLYEEELKIKNAQLTENEGRKVIEVTLEEEQTGYIKSEVSEGATVIINANVTLNKKIASSTEKVRMTISNENAITYENNPIEKDIEIIAPTGMIVSNTMEGQTSIGKEKTKTELIGVSETEKEKNVDIEIINNNGGKTKDIKIVGSFPTAGKENTINTQVTKEINVKGVNAKVYYSTVENATEEKTEANGWKETIEDSKSVKSYLIEIPEMEQGVKAIASYGIEIPANLGYNQKAYEGYNVTYTNDLTKQTNEVEATTLGVTTGNGPELKATLTAFVGGEELKDGDTVMAGETITYKVKVENSGTEEARNVKIKNQTIYPYDSISKKDNQEVTDEKSSIIKDGKDIIIDKVAVNSSNEIEENIELSQDIISDTNIELVSNIIYNENIIDCNKICLKTGEVGLVLDLSQNGEIDANGNDTGEKKENLSLTVNSSANLTLYIANVTEQAKENIEVNIINDEGLETQICYPKIIDENGNELDSKELSINGNKVIVNKIEALQVYSIQMQIIATKENDEYLRISAKAISNSNTYRSNQLKYKIFKEDVSISMSSENANKYVKDNDSISYKIRLKNNGSSNMEGIQLYQKLSPFLEIISIKENGNVIEKGENGNFTKYNISLKSGEAKEYVINTIVQKGTQKNEIFKISSIATVLYGIGYMEDTEEVVHYIEALSKEDDNNKDNNQDDNKGDNNQDNKDNDNNKDDNKNNNNDNKNNNNDNNDENKTYSIVGNVWIDKNADGERQANEQNLNGVKVYLINAQNNELIKNSDGKNIDAITDEQGFYRLEKINKGKYLVIFEFDNQKYIVTKYQAEGVSETKNSDAILNKLNINGEEKEVANTNIISINAESIANIDLGLVEKKDFNFSLEKTISKVMVKNAGGTKTYNINNKTTAKVELRAKYMKNTNMVVEYQIKVTNNGEVDGYVKNIVDYLPNGMKFSSELNTDWYLKDNNLYNVSLANEKIKPGESKIITLILTKVVNSENAEIINNKAEIYDIYNEFGFEDSNSTPGNKLNDEDDMGSADLIITVATGKIIFNISLIIIFINLIILIILLKNKKVIKKGENDE